MELRTCVPATRIMSCCSPVSSKMLVSIPLKRASVSSNALSARTAPACVLNASGTSVTSSVDCVPAPASRVGSSQTPRPRSLPAAVPEPVTAPLSEQIDASMSRRTWEVAFSSASWIRTGVTESMISCFLETRNVSRKCWRRLFKRLRLSNWPTNSSPPVVPTSAPSITALPAAGSRRSSTVHSTRSAVAACFGSSP